MNDKILLVIFDGVGDRYIPALGGTILQVANIPILDYFSEIGSNGIMDPISPGIPPGSDTAHLSIFGYDPYKVYTGRGPFECAGVGIETKKGDIAFRCNFATVDENMIVIDRRAGRIKDIEDITELSKSIDNMKIDGVNIIFKHGVEHRASLLLSGKDLSADITDIDPHNANMKICESKPHNKNAEFTAYVLNKFVKETYNILKEHPVNKKRMNEGKLPANIILPRGSGTVPEIIKFNKKYNVSSCCIAGIPLVKGICGILGMDIIELKGATEGVDTNLDLKFNTAISSLDRYEFVVVNIKAPDIYGHDGDATGKKNFIEKIDKSLKCLKDIDCLKIFTGDHSTPVSVKNHTADPLPITIVGTYVRRDNVNILMKSHVLKAY